MKGILKNFTHTVAALLAVLVLGISSVVGGGVGHTYATAATAGTIMQELERLTIDGEPFKAEDYPADSEGTPQLLMLYESGYSYYGYESLYGLTLYVYNPAQLAVSDDDRNTVQVLVGNAKDPDKYILTLTDYTQDKLFCKFTVKFMGNQKSELLGNLDKDKRTYDVNNIELLNGNALNATSYTVARLFTFTGYAGGLGADPSEESTLEGSLTYTVEGGSEPIEISVKHTSWSPEGTNGNSYYTRDVIHSVYFAVPKEHSEKYDSLQGVKATWYEAQLKYLYVTHNEELYDDLLALKWHNIDNVGLGAREPDDEFDFDYTDFDWLLWAQQLDKPTALPYGEVVFGEAWHVYDAFSDKRPLIIPNDFGLSTLYKYAGYNIEDLLYYLYLPILMDEKELKNGGSVSSNKVAEAVYDTSYQKNIGFGGGVSATKINDKKVASKYPSVLFESWDTEPHTETVRTDEYNGVQLTSQFFKQAWWERVFTGKLNQTDEVNYEKLDAIVEVTGDMVDDKKPEEISKELYISELDADDFKAFCKANSADNTIYILRYAISESSSVLATETKGYKNWQAIRFGHKSTGYFFKDKCYLDFDLIDLEYKKGDEIVVIPVSMSPIDIFPEPKPPAEIVQEPTAFWKLGLIAIGALAVVGVVYGIVVKIKRTNG